MRELPEPIESGGHFFRFEDTDNDALPCERCRKVYVSSVVLKHAKALATCANDHPNQSAFLSFLGAFDGTPP